MTPDLTNLVIIVCGGRSYKDWRRVDQVLDEFKPRVVVHGGEPGAQSLAADWAARTSTTARRYPADWSRFGSSAGPIRNQAMIGNEPEVRLVIAFPGGRGTADMVAKAKMAGLMVYEAERVTSGSEQGELFR